MTAQTLTTCTRGGGGTNPTSSADLLSVPRALMTQSSSAERRSCSIQPQLRSAVHTVAGDPGPCYMLEVPAFPPFCGHCAENPGAWMTKSFVYLEQPKGVSNFVCVRPPSRCHPRATTAATSGPPPRTIRWWSAYQKSGGWSRSTSTSIAFCRPHSDRRPRTLPGSGGPSLYHLFGCCAENQ